jgi:uncharacterized membrane protein YgaE (UPF0421/DUF939 family)
MSSKISTNKTSLLFQSSAKKCVNSPKCRTVLGWTVAMVIVGIIVTFIVIFILPRPPYAVHQQTIVTFNKDYIIKQHYKVYNRNLFPLKLNNINVLIGSEMNNNEECSSMGFGKLDDEDGIVVVPGYSYSDINLIYTYNNITNQEYKQIKEQCYSNHGINYTTSGKVDMEFWMGHFPQVRFGPWVNEHHC